VEQDLGVFVAGGVIAVAQWFPSGEASSAPTLAVRVPDNLQPQAQAGKSASDANCAQCHGANGAGTDHWNRRVTTRR
jgi:mono/diheme cytochrome c family protein